MFSKHDISVNETKNGYLLFVPYGMILYLRSDVVHSGCFGINNIGGPRCHFSIHRSQGFQFDFGGKNWYKSPLKDERLSVFLRHCSIAEKISHLVLMNSKEPKMEQRHAFELVKPQDEVPSSPDSSYFSNDDPYASPRRDDESDDGEN